MSHAAAIGSLLLRNDSLIGLLGIRWGQADDEIDRLNALVDIKVKRFVEESKRTGVPVSPEVDAVLRGEIVYKKRTIWMPVVYSLISISIFVTQAISHPMTLLAAIVFSYFWYDFFSGVLHVILDDPGFIRLPLLKEPCLEFLWHHHIPLVSVL